MNAKNIAVMGIAALGVLGTVAVAPAHADGINWSAIAQCESGNNWSIDSGNGYYGGLQFSESTWLAEGGAQYAQYPNEASESAQIAVASHMSLSNWPVCGAQAYSGGSYTPQVNNYTYKAPAKPQKAPYKPSKTRVNHNTTYPVPDCNGDQYQASYKVLAGDTLSSIGRKYGVTWEAIYNDNTAYISNPDLIYPGQVFCIPNNIAINNG